MIDQSGSYIFDDGQVHNELIAPHASDPVSLMLLGGERRSTQQRLNQQEAARKLWDLSEALVKDFRRFGPFGFLSPTSLAEWSQNTTPKAR